MLFLVLFSRSLAMFDYLFSSSSCVLMKVFFFFVFYDLCFILGVK